MARVLVIRLSSFGDVAMLVPVISSVASRYPQDRFTVLTRRAFTPLFDNLCFNVNVVAFDPAKKHKGIWGLLKLTNKLLGTGITHVADQHNVLRSKFIRMVLRITGSKVRILDKGRDDKQEAINDTSLDHKPLRTTIDRYLDTFEQLGFPAKIAFRSILDFSNKNVDGIRSVTGAKEGKWIAIAPFAKHRGKIYSPDKIANVIESLLKDEEVRVFLFGAGDDENKILNEWVKKYPRVMNMSGRFKLDQELLLISRMDVMLSMDSANMHLASLVNIPVVSIWGATHPSLGFYGFNQDINNAIQIDDLNCRPCSVYGNIPCARGDYACLERIEPNTIVNKIHEVINKPKK